MSRHGSVDMSPAQAIAQRMRAMEAELQQARQALRLDRKRAASDRWGLERPVTESTQEEGWFITYLDMMTLLLVVMIVMLAFSGSIGKRAAAPDAALQAGETPLVALAPIPAPDGDVFVYEAEDAALAFGERLPAEPVHSPLFGTFPDFEPEPPPPPVPVPSISEVLAPIPAPDDIAPYSPEDAALAFVSPAGAESPPTPVIGAPALHEPEAPSEGAALAASLPLSELGHDVEVIVNQRSVSLRINSEILFDTGQTDLSRAGLSVLQRMVKVLSDAGYDITVEGHTDSVPVRSNARYPSNWELSSARAGSVVRYLQANGIAKEHLKAVGYADSRPIAGNGTAEGRARNRRVELMVEKPHRNQDEASPEAARPAAGAAVPEKSAAAPSSL
ncbi:hypothetical protein GCM10009108_02480 [Castellaniella ginsengisoli]|uniref:OmpA-like domain-containing protein n=1 Tax=Castellaniella ginsengisoli TaxID=546114 RepID=A0ABN1KPT9_9BURK